MGLKSKWETRRPLLTQRHKDMRLEYAHENAGRDWDSVIFSDEASFWLKRRRKRVRVASGEEATCPTVKHPQKVHAWACISSNGYGGIATFRQNMDARFFKRILQTAMLPSAAALFPDQPTSDWTLLQDRDPKHRSRMATKYLDNKNVQVLWNPPQSPDLNPIENCWTPLKDKIGERHPTSAAQLENAIHSMWATMDEALLRSTIGSMPRRLEAVIAADGGHTKY